MFVVLMRWAARMSYIHAHMSTGIIVTRRLIGDYIVANHGNFPPSESDLERQGFIKKIITIHGIEYFLWDFAAYKQAWYPCRYPNFDSFTIAYGIKPENIKMIDGKLYDKSTNNQILLIDGPHKRSYQETYERTSAAWHELMLKEKQKAKDQEKPPSSIE